MSKTWEIRMKPVSAIKKAPGIEAKHALHFRPNGGIDKSVEALLSAVPCVRGKTALEKDVRTALCKVVHGIEGVVSVL